MNLLPIEEEAALCREAHKDSQVGDPCWHICLTVLYEPLIEPAENRIAYILSDKDIDQQALRLRLFRPIQKAFIESHEDLRKAWEEWQKADVNYRKAYADYWNAYPYYGKALADHQKVYGDYWKALAKWQKADAVWQKIIDPYHAELCPDCPWDGETIFPEDEK